MSSHLYVHCHSYRHRVYKEARRCPHCGHLMRRNWKPLAVWVTAAIIAVLLSLALVEWLAVGYKPPPPPTVENP